MTAERFCATHNCPLPDGEWTCDPDQDDCEPVDSIQGDTMSECPNCGADWSKTELMSEAHHGGGYHVLCHSCGHEWDDLKASHGAREDARREC